MVSRHLEARYTDPLLVQAYAEYFWSHKARTTYTLGQSVLAHFAAVLPEIEQETNFKERMNGDR